MKLDPKLQREWDERLRRDGLGAGEFDWTIQKKKIVRPQNDVSLAQDFLHEHGFGNDEAGRFDRAVWAAYVEGIPVRKIAAQLGTYRKKVQKAIDRLRALMTGKISRRGRPRDREGRGDDCMTVYVRLDEAESGALLYLEDKLRAAGELGPARKYGAHMDRGHSEIMRKALLFLARSM